MVPYCLWLLPTDSCIEIVVHLSLSQNHSRSHIGEGAFCVVGQRALDWWQVLVGIECLDWPYLVRREELQVLVTLFELCID